jgi:hypothetical protein
MMKHQNRMIKLPARHKINSFVTSSRILRQQYRQLLSLFSNLLVLPSPKSTKVHTVLIKSTMSPRRNWDTLNPIRQRVYPSPRTRLRVRGWGSPNSDDWRVKASHSAYSVPKSNFSLTYLMFCPLPVVIFLQCYEFNIFLLDHHFFCNDNGNIYCNLSHGQKAPSISFSSYFSVC